MNCRMHSQTFSRCETWYENLSGLSFPRSASNGRLMGWCGQRAWNFVGDAVVITSWNMSSASSGHSHHADSTHPLRCVLTFKRFDCFPRWAWDTEGLWTSHLIPSSAVLKKKWDCWRALAKAKDGTGISHRQAWRNVMAGAQWIKWAILSGDWWDLAQLHRQMSLDDRSTLVGVELVGSRPARDDETPDGRKPRCSAQDLTVTVPVLVSGRRCVDSGQSQQGTKRGQALKEPQQHGLWLTTDHRRLRFPLSTTVQERRYPSYLVVSSSAPPPLHHRCCRRSPQNQLISIWKNQGGFTEIKTRPAPGCCRKVKAWSRPLTTPLLQPAGGGADLPTQYSQLSGLPVTLWACFGGSALCVLRPASPTLSPTLAATPLLIIQVPRGQQHHELDTLARLLPVRRRATQLTISLSTY